MFPITSKSDVNAGEHEYHPLLFYRVFVFQRNNFFIGHLWTLLACVCLGNMEMVQRRFVLPLCSFHVLSTPSCFYPVVHPSLWISHPSYLSFHVFQLSFSKLVTGLFICWSCLLFFSPLLDLTFFSLVLTCFHLIAVSSHFFGHSCFSQHCY